LKLSKSLFILVVIFFSGKEAFAQRSNQLTPQDAFLTFIDNQFTLQDFALKNKIKTIECFRENTFSASYTFDIKGNILENIDEESSHNRKHTYLYNDSNHLIEVLSYDYENSITSRIGYKTIGDSTISYSLPEHSYLDYLIEPNDTTRIHLRLDTFGNSVYHFKIIEDNKGKILEESRYENGIVLQTRANTYSSNYCFTNISYFNKLTEKIDSTVKYTSEKKDVKNNIVFMFMKGRENPHSFKQFDKNENVIKYGFYNTEVTFRYNDNNQLIRSTQDGYVNTYTISNERLNTVLQDYEGDIQTFLYKYTFH
jgi:hypothetical protein